MNQTRTTTMVHTTKINISNKLQGPPTASRNSLLLDFCGKAWASFPQKTAANCLLVFSGRQKKKQSNLTSGQIGIIFHQPRSNRRNFSPTVTVQNFPSKNSTKLQKFSQTAGPKTPTHPFTGCVPPAVRSAASSLHLHHLSVDLKGQNSPRENEVWDGRFAGEILNLHVI